MPIFTENDFTIGPRFLEELPVSLGTALKTRFGFSRNLAAGPSIDRLVALNLLEGTINPDVADLGRTFSRVEDVAEFQASLTHITVHEANEQGKPFGLQFTHDTTQEAVDEIIRRKRL